MYEEEENLVLNDTTLTFADPLHFYHYTVLYHSFRVLFFKSNLKINCTFCAFFFLGYVCDDLGQMEALGYTEDNMNDIVKK